MDETGKLHFLDRVCPICLYRAEGADMTEPRQDLGPNQIKWLREKIKPFNLAWKQVRAADRHSEEMFRQLGLTREQWDNLPASEREQIRKGQQ